MGGKKSADGDTEVLLSSPFPGSFQAIQDRQSTAAFRPSSPEQILSEEFLQWNTCPSTPRGAPSSSEAIKSRPDRRRGPSLGSFWATSYFVHHGRPIRLWASRLTWLFHRAELYLGWTPATWARPTSSEALGVKHAGAGMHWNVRLRASKWIVYLTQRFPPL